MNRKAMDWILLGCVGILLVLGSLMIFSISASVSQESFGNTYWFLGHQIIFGILPGIILGFAAFKIKIKNLKKIAPLLLVINLVLLYLVFLPQIGLTRGGGTRWLKFGSISFQPSEFLKITLFIYLAAWLETRKKQDFASLGLFLSILVPISLALILQPDISTLCLLIATSFLIYFLAETPVLHTVLTIAIGTSIIFFLISSAPYRIQRFLTFLSPELDPMKMGYQIKQAQIAIGSGGLFGQGLAMSKQKFGFLPHPISDSIFAIFCEETGFLGALILIALFLVFFTKGLIIAKNTKNRFPKLLACAICFQIILQAFLNIGSMIGLVPLTGVPLPFISYGGTHLLTELIGVGLLLNISRNT